MSSTIEQLQVLYEIAMSIGSSLDLRPMLKNSLVVLLKKLTCSAGGVLFFRPGPISSLALEDLQEIHLEEVFNIPRSIAHNKAYQAAIRRLPKMIPANQLDGFFQQLPLSGQEDPGSYFYILELPDIGLLILTKYGEGLDLVIFKSLKILSNKLAGACKACLQNAELHESEARYRLLFEASADGIIIVDVETKMFKYANPALCRMLGYTDEELKTLGLADIHLKEDLQRIIAEFEAKPAETRLLRSTFHVSGKTAESYMRTSTRPTSHLMVNRTWWEFSGTLPSASRRKKI
jgi:PAS domain S-box-containing protein